MATLGADLTLLTGIKAVEERAQQRLQFLRGEWFLQQDDGIPYYTELLGRQVSPPLVAHALANELESLNGVISVQSASGRFDEQGRFEVNIVLQAEDGTVNVGTTING